MFVQLAFKYLKIAYIVRRWFCYYAVTNIDYTVSQ